MNLKLFIKQSFHDFSHKILLYLSFTFFLILGISISLGMISFSYSFKNDFDQTFGNHKANASLYLNPYLPEWIKENNSNNASYVMKEKVDNENKHGYLYNFAKKILKENEHLFTFEDKEKELKQILLGTGFFAGNVEALTSKDLLEEQKFLGEYIKENDLPKYNENIISLREYLNKNYQTINLAKAYLLEKIKNNPDWILGYSRVWQDTIEIKKITQQRYFWEFLKTDSSMGQVHDETPWTIKTNLTNTKKIWNQVDFNRSEYQSFWENRHFIYVQPTFLQQFDYTIGDTLEIRFTNWDGQKKPEWKKVLLAGTMTTPETLNLSDGIVFSMPYAFVNKVFDTNNNEDISKRPTLYDKSLSFYIKSSGDDLNSGQKTASELISSVFSDLKNPEVLIQNSLDWVKSSPIYAFDLSQTIFLAIAYIIGFATLGLLFLTFYFIAHQIVISQIQTLFFLKSMGVKNSNLSVLTFFALFFPLIIASCASIFGSLLIQQIMNDVALKDLAFYEPYFSFNTVYFTVFAGIIILTSLIFYLINIWLMKSKILTIAGSTQTKPNALLYEKFKIKIQNTPARLRLGLSFTFKNFYKNLITYLILTSSFTITLFSSQFNKSLDWSVHSFEKWNQPYKSVNYAEELKLFSPAETENKFSSEKYVREYDQISNLDGLKPITKIDWENDLDNPQNFIYVIKEYFKSIASEPKSSTFTNWKDYYLEKNFVKEEMNKIVDNPESEFIQKLTKFLKDPPISITDEKTIENIVDLIGRVVEKYRQIRQVYHYDDGLTILMGHVFAPSENRSLFAASATYFQKKPLRILAFEKDDWETQKYFAFSNLSDDDFLVKTPTGEKLLKVNISAYLQSLENLKHGDIIELEISGLRSTQSPSSAKVLVYIDKIVEEDTIFPTIFTSQIGIAKYIIANIKSQINELFLESSQQNEREELQIQLKAYEKLLAQLLDSNNCQSLSNTSFDSSSLLPWGIRYLTIPIFNQTNEEKGSRLEDFYDENEFKTYINNFGSQALIFSEVTKKLVIKSEPFNKILQKFVWILLAVSLIISGILIALILLENKEVILLFKAMGYQKREINWYLIDGYFIASILAVITGISLSFVILNLTNKPLISYLTTTLTFVWSWEFILLSCLLPLIFCGLISISIIIYSNILKPKDAFAAL